MQCVIYRNPLVDGPVFLNEFGDPQNNDGNDAFVTRCTCLHECLQLDMICASAKYGV